MNIKLTEILDLIGKLDDSPGDDNPRERFRRYLKKNQPSPGQVRDYVEECIRNTGEQYNRALQDLVNYAGQFLGFDVEFGRYQGVKGQIGFDGHWISPTGLHIVVEVKTTEVYTIKTATLMDYINQLISEKKIQSLDKALGLYVIGRPDPEIHQLENSIIAEKRVEHLRIISIDSLISLAEMMGEFNVNHDDILFILKPSGANINPFVELITRLVAESPQVEPEPTKIPETVQEIKISSTASTAYWMTPVADDEYRTAEEAIEELVGKSLIYAFGVRTPGRSKLKPDDWICFYAAGNGVVAHAQVASMAEKRMHKTIMHPLDYPWIFDLKNPILYLDNPVIIDSDTRARLDAFRGRDPNKGWAWFVQTTRQISENDFKVLTRH